MLTDKASIASAAPAKSVSAADGYSGYERWKGWTRFFECDAEEAEYFAGELWGIALGGRSVLEIGFGNGSFLAWARAQGAAVSGTEINERSLAEARRSGIELLDVSIENFAPEHAGRFDAIVAFDVFEHFDLDEIFQRIRAVETMLRPGGFVVLRFPNGQSPFGLLPQHGDITHKTALSRHRMEQICQGTSLEPFRYAGSYRVRGPWGLKRIARALRTHAQRAIGATLNLIYACDIPWDSVVVLVLRKQPAPVSSTQVESGTLAR